jgi:general secretion pathway protein M
MTPMAALQARWARLDARERRLTLLGAGVVALALLWWVALAPALHTLRSAPQQHQRLDEQLERMRQLQAQAQALQNRPRVNQADAVRALEQSVREQLGASTQLQINGSQASLTLKNLPAPALALWLSQVRGSAHASVTQARLMRDSAAAPPSWSGTLVLALPEQ